MKKSLSLFLVIAFATFFTFSCKDVGTFSGIVSFSGVPCPKDAPDYKVPPCNGPYPGYEVIVYKKGNDSKPVLTLKTGQDGRFKGDLPEGEWVIYTQSGPSPENKRPWEFTVKAGENTEVNMKVSTGIQ